MDEEYAEEFFNLNKVKMQTHIEKVFRCSENVLVNGELVQLEMAVSEIKFAFTANGDNSHVIIGDKEEFIAITETMVQFLEKLSEYETGKTAE